jgi:hypothetical protein
MLLDKIYLEGYTFEEIKEYLDVVLSKERISEKGISEAVHGSVVKYKEVIDSSLRFTGKQVLRKRVLACLVELQCFRSRGDFKPFKSHCRDHAQVVELLDCQFKGMNVVALEIDKFINHCLGHFDLSKQASMRSVFFHRKQYMHYLFQEEIVKKFFNFIIKFFNTHLFYSEHFSSVYVKLKQLSQMIVSL